MTRELHERVFDIVHANNGELKKNEWSRFNSLKRVMVGVFESANDMEKCVSMFLTDKLVKFDNVNIDYLNTKIEVVVS